MPIGILQLLAILRRDHRQIRFMFYDANAHRVDDFKRGVEGMTGLREVLEADDWDVVGIGGLITAYNYIKQAVKTVKKIRPEAKIVAGGGFFSAIPVEMMGLLPELDYGCVGEAYVTFPDLLNAIDRGEEPTHVDGLAYRVNGSVIFTNPRALIPDLDWLPFPAYDLAPLETYFQYSGILMSDEAMRAKKRLDMNFSLGCPFLCRYCWDLGITSGKVRVGRPGRDTEARQHSPKYIADLIQHLRNDYRDIPIGDGENGLDYPVDFVAWVDENIVAHDAQTGFTWLRDIRDELWKRGLIPECLQKGEKHDYRKHDCLHHGGTAHAGLCKPETLRVMKDIGFTYLDYGLEHFDPEILKTVGKGASPERNRYAIVETMRMGIAPIPNQITMFPDESWNSIKTMLDAWEETGIVSVPFIATPYPGSEWFVKHRDFILQQYGGSLEKFVMDLEDATKVTALITKSFTPVEAIGIQQILGMAAKTQDYRNARRLLWLSEKEWRRRRGLREEDGCFKMIED